MERPDLYGQFGTNVGRLKEAKTPEDKVLYLHIIDSILDDWNEDRPIPSVEGQEDLVWQDYGRGEQ